MKEDKTLVSLHGSYFGNNYGDTLLVCIFARWIKECLPDVIVNLPLANKARTKDLPDGTTGIVNLLRSKFLVFCGGGYFGEQPQNKKHWARRNFWRHGVIGLLAILFRIPYVIIGVEFGPISTSWFRHICILIAKHSRCVVVRNQESKQFLISNGVENVIQSADAVLSLSDMISPSSLVSNNILVHIPGLTNDLQPYLALINGIVECIKEREDTLKILFINDSFSDIYHRDTYKPLLDLLDNNHISYTILPYEGYKELINIINCHKYVITTKLHVGITAAALNKRPLSFWQHPKTKRLHEQIHNSEFCYSLKEDIGIKKIINDYLSQDKPYILPDDIKTMALINKTELIRFINSMHQC